MSSIGGLHIKLIFATGRRKRGLLLPLHASTRYGTISENGALTSSVCLIDPLLLGREPRQPQVSRSFSKCPVVVVCVVHCWPVFVEWGHDAVLHSRLALFLSVCLRLCVCVWAIRLSLCDMPVCVLVFLASVCMRVCVCGGYAQPFTLQHRSTKAIQQCSLPNSNQPWFKDKESILST